MMDLSIIIVNWNAREWLKDCLDSVNEELHNFFSLQTEVYVVENGSDDGSLEMLKRHFPQVLLIENPHNTGFACANNQALSLARGKFLLLLNPDTIIQPGAIKGLIDYLELNPLVGAVGPLILNSDGSIQISVQPFPTLFREAWRLFHLDAFYPFSQYPPKFFHLRATRAVDVVMGACILLRREVLDQTGIFDEQFFVYSEEVDLCLRIHQAGWQIHWLPIAMITHYGGKSTQQVSNEMFLELYRNKIKFFRKHYGYNQTSLYKIILWIVSLIRIMVSGGLKFLPIRNRIMMSETHHRYSQLIEALPRL